MEKHDCFRCHAPVKRWGYDGFGCYPYTQDDLYLNQCIDLCYRCAKHTSVTDFLAENCLRRQLLSHPSVLSGWTPPYRCLSCHGNMSCKDYTSFHIYDLFSSPPILYACGKCKHRLSMDQVLEVFRAEQKKYVYPKQDEHHDCYR